MQILTCHENRVKQARSLGGERGLEAAAPQNGGFKKLITTFES